MKQLDVVSLHRGLEQLHGFDAVYLSDSRRNSMIYLVSSLHLPLGVGGLDMTEGGREVSGRHTLTSYPAKPKNLFHRVTLSQKSDMHTAITTEEDGLDYYAWGLDDSPELIVREQLSQPALENTIRDLMVGACVLDAVTGRELAKLAWACDSDVAGVQAKGQELVTAGNYLSRIDDTTLNDFCQ